MHLKEDDGVGSASLKKVHTPWNPLTFLHSHSFALWIKGRQETMTGGLADKKSAQKLTCRQIVVHYAVNSTVQLSTHSLSPPNAASQKPSQWSSTSKWVSCSLSATSSTSLAGDIRPVSPSLRRDCAWLCCGFSQASGHCFKTACQTVCNSTVTDIAAPGRKGSMHALNCCRNCLEEITSQSCKFSNRVFRNTCLDNTCLGTENAIDRR